MAFLPASTTNRRPALDVVQTVSSSWLPIGVFVTLWLAAPGFLMVISAEPGWETRTRLPLGSVVNESGSVRLSVTGALAIVSVALALPISTGVTVAVVPETVILSMAGNTLLPLASRLGLEQA